MADPLFTVFTATYDRAHTLPRVYESLIRQTLTDFEWLIVDDGSTDGTTALIDRYVAEGRIPIRYHHQENRGKHAAHNRALDLARGALFLNFDSDDACVPHALATFRDAWESIPVAERPGFTGVTCLCDDADGVIVGDRFPTDPFDSNSLDFAFNLKIRGEKWGFHRTEVLRAFPFPDAEGAKFLPEDIVWIPIGARYRTRFINVALRTYHADSGNQLTREQARRQAVAKSAYYDLVVSRYSDRMRRLDTKAKTYINLTRFRALAQAPLVPDYLGRLRIADKALWLATLPAALLMARRDRG